MKKTLAFLLTFGMMTALFTGCAGTTVVVGSCTCPTLSHDVVIAETEAAGTGTLKTGLAMITDLSGSTSAAEGENGQAKFDVTIAAVTVDDSGVIQSCIIDAVPASIPFDASGELECLIVSEFPSKNELGEEYGMKAYGGAKYEWNEQAAAVAAYAVGKTVEELKSGAVNEAGKAADADLATTATISIGGFISAIEDAVANARDLGAQAGDELKLASIALAGKSHGADGENAGLAQLDCDAAVLTMKDGVITSCNIDSVQAKVNFDAVGAITTDLTAPLQTKNQLGENYGMKAWGGAKYEWNEQSAAFASYVTGKTPAQVAGIAVTEDNTPADVDLASTVTISVTGFRNLIEKAAK